MRLNTVDAPFDRDSTRPAAVSAVTSLTTVGRPGGDPRE